MLEIDFRTLLVVAAAHLFVVSAALPMVMGRRVSTAARYVQGSLLIQALGWTFIVLSSYVLDPFFSTLSMACAAFSQWLLHRALSGWLGPRPGERLLLALCVLIPLGYALGIQDYAFRVGWSNYLLAAALLAVAYASVYPRDRPTFGWQWLLCVSQVLLAVMQILRATLGAFFTESYPTFDTPHPVNLTAALVANLSLALNVVALLVAWREEAEGKLRQLAMTDPLTGTLNRRGWTERAQAMFASARRHGHPLSVMILDLDHFKRINDSRGHEAGDAALRLFARQLMACQRRNDLVGRWGGEEFCVMLSHGGPEAGEAFDRRLRRLLQESTPSELGYAVDFSAGLAVLQSTDADLGSLLARADKALYRVKQTGRGRLAEERPATAMPAIAEAI